MKLYHGTCTAGIDVLEARSLLHDTQKRVVYLTDCAPYALLYAWDEVRHQHKGKYVTGWVKDGIAHYEEQFSDQLRIFYQHVAGYLYEISDAGEAKAVDGRDNLFYMENSAAVTRSEFIPDVYEALLQYEAEGKLVVHRYDEQTEHRQIVLTDMISEDILRNMFYGDDPEHQAFLNRYFSEAMERAISKW